MKLFVRNISYDCTEEILRDLFEQSGKVTNVKIVTDRMTGRSRGFGFVEMESEDDAKKAIESLNGQEVEGRPIYVDVARERSSRG